MKKLKIALFLSSSPSYVGGIQEHVYYLSNELIKRGHKVDIYGAKGKNLLPYKNYFPVIQSLAVNVPNGNCAWITFPLKNKEINILINPKNYDICHIQDPYLPFVSWEIMKTVKVPKIATFQGGWDDSSMVNFINPLIPLFKKTYSDNIDGTIFVSSLVEEKWQKICDKKMIKKVIHNGVDLQNYYPAKKEKSDKIKILFVGRLVKRKGPHFILRAIKNIVNDYPKLQLNILGDGILREKLEKFVSFWKLDNYVKFYGSIVGKQKVKFYQEADIFCAPYHDEGFPLTVLEAMACGCPIVGFKSEAFKESLGNYPTSQLLVKYKDSQGFKKGLLKLIVDTRLRKKLSQWCIKKAEGFDIQRTAIETEKLYYQVLG